MACGGMRAVRRCRCASQYRKPRQTMQRASKRAFKREANGKTQNVSMILGVVQTSSRARSRVRVQRARKRWRKACR